LPIVRIYFATQSLLKELRIFVSRIRQQCPGWEDVLVSDHHQRTKSSSAGNHAILSPVFRMIGHGIKLQGGGWAWGPDCIALDTSRGAMRLKGAVEVGHPLYKTYRFRFAQILEDGGRMCQGRS